MYIQNGIVDKVSAHELYFGWKPNLQHLSIFGSNAYVHVPNEKRQKLDPKLESAYWSATLMSRRGINATTPGPNKFE